MVKRVPDDFARALSEGVSVSIGAKRLLGRRGKAGGNGRGRPTTKRFEEIGPELLRLRHSDVLHTAKPSATCRENRRLCLFSPTMPVWGVQHRRGCRTGGEIGGKSPQFDHASIRPRAFAFSTLFIAPPPRTRIHADQERSSDARCTSELNAAFLQSGPHKAVPTVASKKPGHKRCRELARRKEHEQRVRRGGLGKITEH
jgi:hypothetical protein